MEGRNLQGVNQQQDHHDMHRAELITQLGLDIEGEMPGTLAGWSVAMNNDGTIVAVGELGKAQVRVFERSNDKTSWTKKGKTLTIPGAATFGHSVDLSSDGLAIIVGDPKYENSAGDPSGTAIIFEYVADDWMQRGGNEDFLISGTSYSGYVRDGNGSSVAIQKTLSSSLIVALGEEEYMSRTGRATVWQFDSGGTTWRQLGGANDIVGEATDDAAGGAVALSADGTLLAVGSRSSTSMFGSKVFIYNGSFEWTQRGRALTSGFSAVSMSDNGLIVAVGERLAPPLLTGQFRVFEFNRTDWVLRGNPVAGDASGDNFGTDISITADGLILVCGTLSAGYAKVYQYDETDWVFLHKLSETQSDSRFGWSVAISGGSSVGADKAFAIGAPSFTTSVGEEGIIRAFEDVAPADPPSSCCVVRAFRYISNKSTDIWTWLFGG